MAAADGADAEVVLFAAFEVLDFHFAAGDGGAAGPMLEVRICEPLDFVDRTLDAFPIHPDGRGVRAVGGGADDDLLGFANRRGVELFGRETEADLLRALAAIEQIGHQIHLGHFVAGLLDERFNRLARGAQLGFERVDDGQLRREILGAGVEDGCGGSRRRQRPVGFRADRDGREAALLGQFLRFE